MPHDKRREQGGRVIYIDTSLKSWCDRFGFPSDSISCDACTQSVSPRPIRMKGYAGLEYKCGCGGKFSESVKLTPIDTDTKEFWATVLGVPQ